jgi:hypothetical protein
MRTNAQGGFMGTSVDRYGIKFEHRPDYLYVRVDAAANNYEVSSKYWREILSVLNRRHYLRMVVEEVSLVTCRRLTLIASSHSLLARYIQA